MQEYTELAKWIDVAKGLFLPCGIIPAGLMTFYGIRFWLTQRNWGASDIVDPTKPCEEKQN